MRRVNHHRHGAALALRLHGNDHLFLIGGVKTRGLLDFMLAQNRCVPSDFLRGVTQEIGLREALPDHIDCAVGEAARMQ